MSIMIWVVDHQVLIL